MPKAVLIFRDKRVLENGGIVEMKIWRLPASVPPSTHRLKYSLYYGRSGVRLVGYDNERGKGDHRHIGTMELAYTFTDVEQLIADFLADVVAAGGRLE